MFEKIALKNDGNKAALREHDASALEQLSANAAEWSSDQPILSLKNLNVSFLVGRKLIHIVRDLNLDIMPNTVMCIVGETGCGKSVTATAALHLLPDNAQVEGSILFRGVDVGKMDDEEFRHLRGSQMMSIPQNPSTALDPLMRVGAQVEECAEVVDSAGAGKAQAQPMTRKEQKAARRARVVQLFDRLRLPDPDRTYKRYPSELSGGMNQRVLISMGAITHPDLLVVDEPTKAIDWSLRRNVLEMLQDLKAETSCAMMLITHDIPLARRIADRVAVIYAGRIVEQGNGEEVLRSPLHPYTRALLDSLPENGFNAMRGFMPSFEELPEGCSFWPRCPYADETCKQAVPTARKVGDREVSCHHPLMGGDSE